jgi:putative ABC transport system permease protein
MMENLMQDIRYGFRTLAKNPGFTGVAVLTLALGIGANTAIFSVVQNVLLRPLPYTQPESLVQIFNAYMPQFPRIGLSPGDLADWRRQATSFSEVGAYSEISQGFNLTGEGAPERIQSGYASSTLFPMLGVQLTAGRQFVPEEDKAGSAPVVILSHRLWESRYGGDLQVVGRTIKLDNQRYTVAGVLPAGFQLLQWADLWMPIGQFPDELTSHVHHEFIAIARLKPGVHVSEAQAEITSLNHQEEIAFPDTHKNWSVVVQRLEAASATRLRSTLLVLSGAVGLVLLIACANIVNLLLVRNAAREREVAVRTALGANRWRLIRQMLTESALISLLGGALGLLFAFLGLRALTALVPPGLAELEHTGLNSRVLGFTIAVSFASGLLCGVMPAFQMLKTNLASVLRQGSKGSGEFGRHRIHNALVVSEIAMALIPLIGAGLLLRSFQQLLQVDPGFRATHILTMEVPQAQLTLAQANQLSDAQQQELTQKQSLQFEQIAEQIRALPGVQQVGGISVLPLASELRSASRFLLEDQVVSQSGARPVAQTRSVSLGYFATLGIPLIEGRIFRQQDWALTNIVINQALARRFWPRGGAMGRRINLCTLDPKPCLFSIVGVVGDVHQLGLDGESTFDVYFAGGWTRYFVIRSATDPASLAAAATAAIHAADPTLPVTHVMAMDNLFSETVASRRFSATLVAVFSILALLLAAVGIYGVMSYTVSQRTHEIGIRMALGAHPARVRKMIFAHTLKLTFGGIALGLAGSFALVRFLSSLLFGVGAYDVVTFLGVPALLAVVALAACYLPARRAVRVDPLVALRYE